MGADTSLPPSTCGISKLPNPEQNRGVKTSTMVVVFYSVVEKTWVCKNVLKQIIPFFPNMDINDKKNQARSIFIYQGF